MRMNGSIVIASIVMLLLSVNSYAADKVVFGTFPIPAMVVDSNTGVFIELTREITKRANMDIEFTIAPPKRTFKSFFEEKVDAVFPALDVNFPTGIRPVKSDEIIYVKVDYVFTKKGTPFLKTLQDLEGKKIGITFGYPYASELISNNLITLDTAPTDEMNTKKLIKGRLDAFVVEEKSGVKAFRNAGLEPQMQYDPKVPLSKQDVYYAFQNSEKGRKMAKRLSEILKQMKADGTFQKIMSGAN